MESCQRGNLAHQRLVLQSHLQALLNAQGTETQVICCPAGQSLKTRLNVVPSGRYVPTKETLLLQPPEREGPYLTWCWANSLFPDVTDGLWFLGDCSEILWCLTFSLESPGFSAPAKHPKLHSHTKKKCDLVVRDLTSPAVKQQLDLHCTDVSVLKHLVS